MTSSPTAPQRSMSYTRRRRARAQRGGPAAIEVGNGTRRDLRACGDGPLVSHRRQCRAMRVVSAQVSDTGLPHGDPVLSAVGGHRVAARIAGPAAARPRSTWPAGRRPAAPPARRPASSSRRAPERSRGPGRTPTASMTCICARLVRTSGLWSAHASSPAGSSTSPGAQRVGTRSGWRSAWTPRRCQELPINEQACQGLGLPAGGMGTASAVGTADR
jgi:hypothetical protein